MWRSFWQGIFRFQSEKINPWIGLRNAIGVLIPLAVGAAIGNTTGGVIGATGALNVAFRDSLSPYAQRARQMLLASLIAGVAVFMGGLTGHSNLFAILIAGVWAFSAGMLVSIGDAAADLGTMSVVILVVYGANPMQPSTALLSGLTALGGGLLQTALSIASWPFRPYSPERRALADLYMELSRAATDMRVEPGEAPPATAQSVQAQTALASLGRDRSAERDRYRFLLSQAERIRLSLLALSRIRARAGRENPVPEQLGVLDRGLRIAASALQAICVSLRSGAPPASPNLNEMDDLAERLRDSHTMLSHTMFNDARFQIDALAGQLRAALDVAAQPPDTITRVEDAAKPWRMRAGGKVATIIANLNLGSTAFRHAIRLAVCIVIGEALGRGMGFARPYWIPMTIAIVLKPDFGATFQRGVLRLLGTYAGLIVATLLVHAFPEAVSAHIGLITALMFLARCFGPANYGIVAIAISAVVVFLISLTGIPAQQVIGARALNTSIGGAIALLAYWLWPTWERHRVAETAATMLDAFLDYFRAIRAGSRVEEKRTAGRLARSNLEASIGRAASEPGVSAERMALANGMMASSRRLAQSLMSLEAAGVPRDARFGRFADDVEFTLQHLSQFLRGGKIELLPDLREDHYDLVRFGDRHALVNIEADRITNSLNTLSAQVLHWLDLQA